MPDVAVFEGRTIDSPLSALILATCWGALGHGTAFPAGRLR